MGTRSPGKSGRSLSLVPLLLPRSRRIQRPPYQPTAACSLEPRRLSSRRSARTDRPTRQRQGICNSRFDDFQVAMTRCIPPQPCYLGQSIRGERSPSERRSPPSRRSNRLTVGCVSQRAARNLHELPRIVRGDAEVTRDLRIVLARSPIRQCQSVPAAQTFHRPQRSLQVLFGRYDLIEARSAIGNLGQRARLFVEGAPARTPTSIAAQI